MTEVVLPRDVASSVIVNAAALAQRVVAVGGSVGAIAMTTEYLRADGVSWTAVLIVCSPLLLILLLAIVLLAHPRIATAIAYVAGGAVASVALIVLAEANAPQITDSGPYLINRAATAVVLVGALRGSARSGIRWTIVAFLVAEASLFGGFALADIDAPTGWGPTLAAAIGLAAYGTMAYARAHARKRVPHLDQLQVRVAEAERRREIELRAAAVVHDTILADLTAIASTSGPLSAASTQVLHRDLARISASSARSASQVPDARPTVLSDALAELVGDVQWSGMTVAVSGADDLPESVPSAVHDAVVGAVQAALHNVAAHSESDQAELVLGVRDGVLVILIVDAGKGFDPQAVASDRLGMSTSIDRRIRSVGGTLRVWSGDEGTTVMISIPLGTGSP